MTIIFAFFVLNFVRAHECDASGDCEHNHDEEIKTDYSWVTCGSVIKLRHANTNYRLHSHEVSYGNSGSGQQSVTAVSSLDDRNSLWMVQGSDSKMCSAGQKIKNGDVIRLRHVSTRKNLHSHLHKSPLSGNQEISCFDENVADSGDNWIVEITTGEHWKRAQPIRLKHVDTGKYLETDKRYKFGQPIVGQLEVFGSTAKTSNNLWASEEGMYIAADNSNN